MENSKGISYTSNLISVKSTETLSNEQNNNKKMNETQLTTQGDPLRSLIRRLTQYNVCNVENIIRQR